MSGRTRALFPVVLSGAFFALPACSLLGLDRLEQSTCDMAGGDAFCASLESAQPTGDACLRWQCNEDTRHCEIEPRDVDSDGSPAAMCEPAGVAPDCDDDDRENAPTLTEVCDGNDDDCDGAVDENTVGQAMLSSLQDLPASTTDVALGRAADADENVIAALTAAGQVALVIDRTSSGFVTAPVRTVGDVALVPRGLSAIAGIGMNRYAVLFELLGSCQRIVLGVLDTTTMLVRVPDAHSDSGFPSSMGDCSGTTTPTSTGNLARDPASGDLLVAYLESVRRECGAAPATRVLVIGAPDAAPAAAGITPLDLGQSVDPRPPAIVSLGARVFLVAFPTADGAVAVHRVTLALDGSATATLVYTEPADAGGLRSDVALSLGATLDGTTTVALTYAYGCGSAPVALRFFSVMGSTVTAGARVAGTAPSGARAPTATYQSTLAEWLLAWRTPMALGGLRVDADSMAVGDGFALTLETGGFTAPFAVVAPGRTAGVSYRVLTTRVDAGTTRAVAAELGCLPVPVSP